MLRKLNERDAVQSVDKGLPFAQHRPINIHLQVASGCNLDCYMCIEHLRPPETRRGRNLQSLSRDVFDKLCSQVFPYSSNLHLGFGGEPTLAPDFLYYIERGFENGQSIDLTTNGTQLGRHGMCSTIARCVSSIRVSIDAATKETYERIRLGSSWSHLRAGIDKLNEARFEIPEEGRTRLTLVFVLMKSNLHELPAFVELAKTLLADCVRCQHVIPTTEEGQRESLFDEVQRYNTTRAEAAELAAQLGIEFDVPAPYPTQALAPDSAHPVTPADDIAAESCSPDPAPLFECQLPRLDLFITYQGKITPCCNPHANAKMLIGDLSTEDFEDIWNNEAYLALRASFSSGVVHPICKTCKIGRGPQADEPEDSTWLLSTPPLNEWAAKQPSTEFAYRPSMFDGLQASGWLEHMSDLTDERDALRSHAQALEDLQAHQLGHIANLESERPHLLGHIENLEALRDGGYGRGLLRALNPFSKKNG